VRQSRLLKALFVATLALGAPSAFAQETSVAVEEGAKQTPEGAQRFLTLIAEQQPVFVYPTRQTWPAFGAAYRAAMAGNGTCETRVHGKLATYFNGKTWIPADSTQFNQGRLTALHTQYRVPAPPYTIDWSRVSSVQIVDGVAVNEVGTPGRVVLTSGASGSVQLLFEDPVTAKRVRYAMEFLKTHCDKTAETGF
jgi:hypothetical protein